MPPGSCSWIHRSKRGASLGRPATAGKSTSIDREALRAPARNAPALPSRRERDRPGCSGSQVRRSSCRSTFQPEAGRSRHRCPPWPPSAPCDQSVQGRCRTIPSPPPVEAHLKILGARMRSDRIDRKASSSRCVEVMSPSLSASCHGRDSNVYMWSASARGSRSVSRWSHFSLPECPKRRSGLLEFNAPPDTSAAFDPDVAMEWPRGGANRPRCTPITAMKPTYFAQRVRTFRRTYFAVGMRG